MAKAKFSTTPRYKNIAGKRFGRLVAIRPSNERKDRRVTWHCICDCGNKKIVTGKSLRAKTCGTKSCGCLARDRTTERNLKHGKAGSPMHKIWIGMRSRCLSPNNQDFHLYGGRGITVCNRWEHFENFAEDMGERPSPLHSLDRIDNDGPYSPENCRWATPTQQGRNTRKNKMLTFKGKTLPLCVWAEKLNIPYDILNKRLFRGWSIERAFAQPIRKHWSRQ